MEFDRSRVYTSLNADELRAGDKVIVADDMLTLKAKVSEGFNWYVVAITSILGEGWYGRFDIDKRNFPLAYLVERAENCTNCGEGKWDAEHKKILCDPAHCGNGNVIFRNHEIEVCEYWKPKTERKAEMPELISLGNGQYAEKEKHYRPFKDTDELVKVWCEKCPAHNHRERGLTMPLIWVRSKSNQTVCLITKFFLRSVVFGYWDYEHDEVYSMPDFFKYWEFLDGSPCGVEE